MSENSAMLKSLAAALFSLLVISVPAVVHAHSKTDFNSPRSAVISGDGGVPLVVQEWGNPDGVPILLLHGMGFSSVVFKNQIGELAEKARIVSFDLRGHGLSGKPWKSEDYAGWEVWARDVEAVIADRGLDRPVIVGWSFGGYVAMNYLRHCGVHCARGVVLASSLAGLVENPPPPDPADYGMPEPAGDVRSDNYHELFDGIAWTSRVMTAQPSSFSNKRLMELSMAMSPPYAKRAMMEIWLDNSDLPGHLNLPILMIHGAIDGTVTLEKVAELKAHLPDSRSILYPESGHSPFLEEPDRFNRDLLEFLAELELNTALAEGRSAAITDR
ncbi:alpha/beta fold hydrolase [Altererythrobacter sp. GH1-8]|uniref:alpha/beta fold hydrolase n=1 Tax=Altererythrobacter sp. GH1-8 TaxID=3349333 RepID=UPI00374D1084